MKKILLVLLISSFYLSESFGQNGIIGSGFGANDWSTTNGFTESAGGSRIGTFTANGTGNQYFRTVINWDANYDQFTITSGSDVLVSVENELTPNQGPTTSGAMFLNVSNTSHNYVFKTRGGGTNPSHNLIIFQVQGDIRSVSSVGRDKTTVYRGQSITVTANLDNALSTGQGVYLRYTTDNFSNSTVVEMTGSGTTYTGDIPSGTNTANTVVSYYVFTSGDGLAITSLNADWYTINLNNNGGSNYSYTVNSAFITAQNGNWNSGGTWVDGVPTDNAAIILDHNITLDKAATVSSLTINSGATFTASDATPRTLTISKSTSGSTTTLSNSGTWANGSGGSTVVFTGAPSSGDAVHAITGTIAFQNITVNKTGGTSNVGASFGANSSVSGTLEIGSGGYVATAPPTSFYGANAILKFNQGSGAIYNVESGDYSWSTTEVPNYITVASGTVNLNAPRSATGDLIIDGGILAIESSLTINGSFTNNAAAANLIINSDATSTGSFITNGTVTGSITAQRYIPGYTKGTTGFHLLSSPVASQLISTEFVDVAAIPTTTDFYYFNEEHNYWINIKNGSGTYNQGLTWENFSNDANPAFVVGKGYLVGYSAAQTDKEFTGIPNTGNLTSGTGIPAITFTEGLGNGWNLVGNPYPSAIDWDHAEWVKTNINSSVYVYDGSSGNYVSWNGTSGGLTDGVIPAMQGFFIKADAASPALTIPNNARVHSTSNIYKSSTSKVADNNLVLQCESQGLSDKLYLQFASEATENYDGQFDAYKLMGTGDSPQIYSNSTDGKLLSINALPVVNEELLIPVNVKVILPGIHTISLPVNTLLVGQNLLLEDKKEQITVKFSTEESYSFLAEENDNPDRFTLHFGVTGLSDNTALATLRAYVSHGQLTILGETGELNVDILDMQGRVLERRAVQMDGSYSQPLNLPAGVYVVRVCNGQAAKSVKVILTNR